MAYNFMTYASIANKFKGKRTMLKNRLMASLDNILYEFYSAIFCNFILGFITYSTTLFNSFKDCFTINRCNKFNIWLNNLHNYSSLKLYPISFIEGFINRNNVSASSITILSFIPLL
jgi:hypothetical protein